MLLRGKIFVAYSLFHFGFFIVVSAKERPARNSIQLLCNRFSARNADIPFSFCHLLFWYEVYGIWNLIWLAVSYHIMYSIKPVLLILCRMQKGRPLH